LKTSSLASESDSSAHIRVARSVAKARQRAAKISSQVKTIVH
jgi:hypothetical protein